MSERALRWGVLSTSNIGRRAVNPAIQASRNGELIAVASRDAETAALFAEELSIPRSYGSYAALLEDDDIEAVYIPLPNSLHREWTIRAAEAGKHILCEKPLALNEADCLEMAAAAEERGVKLMEAFMYRFHPRTERVIEMVGAGALGELKLIRSAFTFFLSSDRNIRLDAGLGGGALRDVGCYCVNISRTLTGAEPTAVQALARFDEADVDLELAGTMRFPGDVVAQFDCGVKMTRRELWEVVGTEAWLEMPTAFLPGKDNVVIHQQRNFEDPVEHMIQGADEYQLMVEHFADCVLDDRPVRYSPVEAAANMRVVEALYRSARSGGDWTEVDPTP